MSFQKPLEGVVLEPNLEKFIEARESFGSQQEASDALGLGGQTVISHIETKRSVLCSRTYTLMLLLAQMHDNYELKARKRAKSIAQFVIEPDGGLKDVAGELVQAQADADIDQKQLAQLLECSETTIKSYENGLGVPSDRFYTVLALIFERHPFFYLKKRVKNK